METRNLINLLNRAAVAVGAIDLSDADVVALRRELMAAANDLNPDGPDYDEQGNLISELDN